MGRRPSPAPPSNLSLPPSPLPAPLQVLLFCQMTTMLDVIQVRALHPPGRPLPRPTTRRADPFPACAGGLSLSLPISLPLTPTLTPTLTLTSLPPARQGYLFHVGVRCARIDGNTSSADRTRLIRQFNGGRAPARRARGGRSAVDGSDEEENEEENEEEEAEGSDGGPDGEEEDEEEDEEDEDDEEDDEGSGEGGEEGGGAPPPVFLLSTRAGGVGINLQARHSSSRPLSRPLSRPYLVPI